MKKILSLIAAVMATMTMSAQTAGIQTFKLDGSLTRQSNEIAAPVRKAAPRKALAENQQYMGAYTTDEYSESGLGLTGYPGTYEMYADIPASLLSAYDGGSVVGMRFAVAQACNTTKCYIYNSTDAGMTLLAEGAVTSSTAGWNTVMFDTPFTLDLSTIGELMMGYDYVQTSSNYPIAVAEAGTICTTYLYGNLGSGKGYYDIGLADYGNLCVQAIVEKDYAKNSVAGVSCKDVYAQIGEAANLKVYFQSWGTNDVNNISYTVTCDGTTSEEKTVALDEACTEFGGSFYVNIPVDAQAEANTKVYTVTVTKVNGEANESDANTIDCTVITVKKLFTHNVTVEEYTGLGCGWCPRGWVGMNNLRETFGDRVVGIALHQYSGQSTDAMNISSTKYAKLSFSGAPSCMLERGEEMDPYYGTGEDIRDDVQAALEEVAAAGVEVSGQFNADYTEVAATATIESLTDRTYDIEYVLIADGLTGTGAGWRQSNYYASYYSSSQLPEDLAPFGSGGDYGKSTVSGLIFNDVAIASSYKSSKNQATLGDLTAYTPVENTFTLTMPTYTKLLTAIKNANYDVWVAALIIDPSTGKIVNAAKSKVAVDPTGIKNVSTENANADVMYNIAGQRVSDNAKGIVIVNGKKVLVK